MKFTFTVKIWQKERPEAANGVGVAKAITKVEATCAKEADKMDASEVTAALSALDELKVAIEKGDTAIKKDGKNKDRSKILGLIKKWLSEIEEACQTLRPLVYNIRKVAVQKTLDEKFEMQQQRFLPAYQAAKLAHEQFTNQNAPKEPVPALVQKWLGEARDMATFCSKTVITQFPEGKQVKVE